MIEFLDDKAREQVRRRFQELKYGIKIIYFTQENACFECQLQQELLEKVVAQSSKIQLEIRDFVKDSDLVRKYGINKIPATAVVDDKDYGIRFYGVTAGYEFASLIDAILLVSTGKTNIEPDLEEKIKSICDPIHIQVMAAITCPFCSIAVQTAFQLAVLNENIKADMIDVDRFPMMINRYEIGTVPKTIINESYSFVGALSAEDIYAEIIKAIRPEEYRRMQEEMQIIGKSPFKQGEEGRNYDLIIVGGGPAAMSASIYAARKELDILVITKNIGGQVNYTSTVDNYLGIKNINGKELVRQFRDHMEKYPISEALNHEVVKIEKNSSIFSVTTKDGKIFSSYSLIYAAGKEYRKLGLPSEDKFIGKGVAFCATCDAPLYRGKRVAVVGGGNSAFTSARELQKIASEVYIVHILDEFQADPVLVREVAEAPNVKFLKQMEVRELLGNSHISGIRLVSTDGRERIDLHIDGIFLGIGMAPNVSPVRGFISLNDQEEIPIRPDTSTTIPGFFAAGDVSDIPEKQIVVAAGEGAKAAVTAYTYLLNNRLVKATEKAHAGW